MLKKHLNSFQTRNASFLKTNSVDRDLRTKASDEFVTASTADILILHTNQTTVEAELRKMKDHQTQLQRQCTQWEQLYDELIQSMKEAGDLVNYAKVIEQQLEQKNT